MLESSTQGPHLIWSFAFERHPDEALRNRISAALGLATSVPHPQADYYWREQGLSLYAYESPCSGPPAELRNRCCQQSALIGSGWKIGPLQSSGAFSGYLETNEPRIIPSLIWASFQFDPWRGRPRG